MFMCVCVCVSRPCNLIYVHHIGAQQAAGCCCLDLRRLICLGDARRLRSSYCLFVVVVVVCDVLLSDCFE